MMKRLLSLLPVPVGLMPCDYDHGAFEAFAPALADAPVVTVLGKLYRELSCSDGIPIASSELRRLWSIFN